MEPQIAVCTRSLEQERFNEPQVVGAQDEGRKVSRGPNGVAAASAARAQQPHGDLQARHVRM